MRAHTVAIISDEGSGYNRQVVRGVMDYALAHRDWRLAFAVRPIIHWKDVPRFALDADGYICEVSHVEVRDVLFQHILPTGRPVVNTAGTYVRNMSFVGPDRRACGRIAGEHLASLGFRNFGLAVFAPDDLLSEGFRAALPPGSHVCAVPATIPAHCVTEWPDYFRALQEWVVGLPKPIGILAANDFRAAHVLMACQARDVPVPEEVAIVGVDDDRDRSQMLPVSLTSIDVNAPRIGFEAARLLDGMMRSRTPIVKEVHVPPKGLIARQSTDTLAIADRVISRCCTILRERVAEHVGLNDLARELSVSRTQLCTRFRRAMRQSPHQYQLRLRIWKARDLLADTDWSIGQVADHCGFSAIHIFSRTFKEKTGLNPSEYRQQVRANAL